MFARIARSYRPIDIAEWKNVIAAHPALEPMPDRVGVDPFTQEKVLFPGEGRAFYIEDGQRVGNAAFENGEVLTTAIPQNVCEEVAAQLAAKVFDDDRS